MKITDFKRNTHCILTQLPTSERLAVPLIELGMFVGCQLQLISKSSNKGPVALKFLGTNFSIPYDIASNISAELSDRRARCTNEINGGVSE